MTPAELVSLDKSDSTSGQKLTLAQAKQIAGLNVTVAMSSDKPLKDVLSSAPTDATKPNPKLNMDLSVHTGTGTDLVEYRTVAGKVYLKLDFEALAALSGDNSSTAGLDEMKANLNSLPPQLAPLKSLLNGDWLEIDPAKFTQLAKSLGNSNPDTSPSPIPSLNPATRQKLQDVLTSVLTKDTSFSDKGVTGNLDTIQVQANNPRTLIADIEKQVFPLLKNLPGLPSGASTSLPTSVPTDAPTSPIVATIQLNQNDGTLNNLSFDFGQFDTGHKTHLGLKVSFQDQAAAATAPAGAVVFDPSMLEAMMNATASGSGAGSTQLGG